MAATSWEDIPVPPFPLIKLKNKGRATNDYCVVELNADGSKKEDKTIGGTSYAFQTILQQTSHGGYIAEGWSESGKGAANQVK